MELKVSSTESFFQEIDLDLDIESGEFKRFIVNCIRNFYSGSGDGALARSIKKQVFDYLGNFIDTTNLAEDLKETISELHDLLATLGELVQLPNEVYLTKFRIQLPMYVVVSRNSKDESIRTMLFGPSWIYESRELTRGLTYNDESGVRYLSGTEVAVSEYFEDFNLASISNDQWRGYPRIHTREEILLEATKSLLDHETSREIEDLQIIEKGHKNYFRGRFRKPKKFDSGIFVARRVQEYGSEGSYIARIIDGKCTHIRALPIESIASSERDCEFLIVSAFDSEVTQPGYVKVDGPLLDKGRFNFFHISFYMPPVSWLQKFLMSVGNQVPKPRKGALITYALPSESLETALEQVEHDMFLQSKR
jgi:hypothetical protein